MTQVFERKAIEAGLESINLLPRIEAGFVAYSEGRCIIPPVGELVMDKGEVHIKYGCVRGEPYYVVKIASGFYGNPELGQPSGNGMMLLFSQETGEPVAVLCDEGHLTDVRTAAAGAVGAKALAPKKVDRIGILGTGLQARLQLLQLMPVVDCRRVLAWGRNDAKLAAYAEEMRAADFEVETTDNAADIPSSCQLIVTTTTSTEPLLNQVEPGTHITAIGSDTPEKRELAGSILSAADLVVADSIEQCCLRGEIFQAMQDRSIARESLVELGDILGGKKPGRTADEQITVFDSTGVAVQDLAIAQAVYEKLSG
ncbi:MAG: Rossmann-fold NAD(P)-binding domain-containing protein [Planctomycetota bacterium]|jgi:ornithine cyclodeaminase